MESINGQFEKRGMVIGRKRSVLDDNSVRRGNKNEARGQSLDSFKSFFKPNVF